MADKKIRITTAVFYKFMSVAVLGLMIASCDLIVSNPETRQVESQTEEITLESGAGSQSTKIKSKCWIKHK